MERFVIVMPVGTSAYLLPCDDGDTCKLETLQKLVGGPIEMADTCLAASWAREDVDSIQMAVNEEGLQINGRSIICLTLHQITIKKYYIRENGYFLLHNQSKGVAGFS